MGISLWSLGVRPFGSFTTPSVGEKPNLEDFIGALDGIRTRFVAKQISFYDLSLMLVEQWHPLNDSVIQLAGAEGLNQNAFAELTLLPHEPHETRIRVLTAINERIGILTTDALRDAPINHLLRYLGEVAFQVPLVVFDGEHIIVLFLIH